MAALTYLSRSLSAETLKLKNTLALLAAAGAPLFIISLSFLIYYFKGHEMLKPGENPWLPYTRHSLQVWALLFMPLYIGLAAALVCAVEHQSNTWKQLYSLPLPRWTVYGAKLLVFTGLIFLSMALMFVLNQAGGYLLGLLRPEFGFQNFNIAWPAAQVMAKITLAALGIMAVQFFVSFRFRNFVFPIGLGFVLTVAGNVLLRWEHVHFYPYVYPFLSFINTNPEDIRVFSTEVGRSLVVFGLVSALGLLASVRRNVQ